MKTSLTLYETSGSIIGSDFASKLIPQAAFENSDNIQKLNRIKGREFTVLMVTTLLNESLIFVKNRLDPKQMAAYANMFVSQNPTLTIDELVIILTKGINGEYGKSYGDFDYMVLTDWRNQYEKGDRANYLEEKHTSKYPNDQRISIGGSSLGDSAKNNLNHTIKKIGQ